MSVPNPLRTRGSLGPSASRTSRPRDPRRRRTSLRTLQGDWREMMTITLISVLFLSILQCPFGEARVVVCRSRFRDFSLNFRVFSSKFHQNQQISTKNLQKMMKIREILMKWTRFLSIFIETDTKWTRFLSIFMEADKKWTRNGHAKNEQKQKKNQ